MSLESNFFKKENYERISTEEMKRKRMQDYLMSKFGMGQSISSKVVDLLERTQLNYEKLSSGIYDSIISMALEKVKASENQGIQQRDENNAESDLIQICKTEVKESVTAPVSYSQPQSQISQDPQQLQDVKKESQNQFQQLLNRINAQREEIRSRHFR